jgi:protein involved in polysaccharide export with SLBB domain
MYKSFIMFKKSFSFFIFLVLILVGTGVGTISSQTVPGNIEFSRIKVDELTDQQVRQFIARAQTTGMTMQELEAEAINRGMPYSEVVKLRSRIQNLDLADDKAPLNRERGTRGVFNDEELSRRLFPEMEDGEQTEEDSLKIFGYDLFRRENLSFEPSLNIPTPTNYVLGTGDQLLVEVWGASQQSYELTISPEGQVRISNLGPVKVGGLTIEKASELIIQRLSGIYSGLRGPNANTFAQVSIGNIRSIKVTIAGDAYLPGTYTLPAFATAFNALYLAGGPSDKGSFREIIIMRDNQPVAKLDLYHFLLKGETIHNIRLRDEDLVFIGPSRNLIRLHGEVIRPAIYELRENETLADLIAFAGGFSPAAYTRRLQVDRKTENQRRMLNVENDLFSSFLMRAGDQLIVGPVLEKYENRVTIQGAVFREGEYALTEGFTVKQLIERAEGLREDAFLHRAAIYRQRDNLELEVIDIDLATLFEGTAPDLTLQREDLLVISSITDLHEERVVNIMGEVQNPGTFDWGHNITLGEIIRQAGGLNHAASLARVEVARRVTNRQALKAGNKTTEVITFPINENLALGDEAASFALHPFDMIFVRRSPDYQQQKLVQLRGEVAFPGSYAIAGKNEYISDLVLRAGGLTAEAYLPGARLARKTDKSRQDRIKRLQAVENIEVDIEDEATTHDDFEHIGIDLETILKNPRSRHDLIVMEGDILEIPQQLQTVKMTGAVLHPTSAIYQPNRGVRTYVTRAGGFSDNAMRSKVYVLHPNGSVNRTRSFMMIRSYPAVEPGSEIIVPQKPERQGRTLQETVAISSALTSLALVIVTLIGKL